MPRQIRELPAGVNVDDVVRARGVPAVATCQRRPIACLHSSADGAASEAGRSRIVALDLSALDTATLTGCPAHLTFAWDATNGSNGDTLHLTITNTNTLATRKPSFMIRSQLRGLTMYWLGVVSND